MTFAIDPVISNVFFTLSGVLHATSPSRSPPYLSPSEPIPGEDLSDLLVLVPVYKESQQAIQKTFTSIANQTYPVDRLHVRCIVEEDDEATQDIVEDHEDLLSGIDFQVVMNGEEGMKATALNHALDEEEVDTEYLVVYDADDKFEENQLMKMVGLAEEHGHDVVMPRVYRVGDGLLSKFLTLDTHVWYAKAVPFLQKHFGVFPLSGEGLFARRNMVEELGGFPHSLTEDAMLSIEIAEHEGSFGLVDSEVYERAPTSLKGHFTQRLRWNRGYFSCLRKLISADLSPRHRAGFALPFIAPITLFSTLPAWVLFAAFWVVFFTGGVSVVAPWMTSSLYLPIFYWSAGLGYLGNVLIIFSTMHTIAGTDYEQYAPYTFLLPFYWMFLSITAIGSIFKSSDVWGRTDRSP